jgi:transcriptional regulator with XRE-family HTH domain
MNNISENIKLLREEKNLSRKKLAELAGVSQPTIYNIENGKTDNVTLTVGKSIAKALGTTFGELFQIEGAGKSSEGLLEMISELRQKIVDLQSNIAEKNQLIKLLQKENKRLFREKSELLLAKDFLDYYETKSKIENSKNQEEIEQLEIWQKGNIESIQNRIEDIFDSELFIKFEVLEMIYESDIFTSALYESVPEHEFTNELTKHLNIFIKVSKEEIDIFLNKYSSKFSRSG